MTEQISQELGGLSGAELVGIYNGLCPDAPIKRWAKPKSGLIKRIDDLRAQVTTGSQPVSATGAADTAPEATEKKPDGETVQKQTGNGSDRTIRAAALELLCRVEYHEDRASVSSPNNVVKADHPSARSVGLAYDKIIHGIEGEFPGCNTTVACLRWYAVKVRAEEFGYEGLRLPQRRPRVKPRKS